MLPISVLNQNQSRKPTLSLFSSLHPKPVGWIHRQANRRSLKKPLLNEKLLVNLKKSAAIREFAIFDEANFLHHQSSDSCSLAKVNPAFYLSECRSLGKSLEGNKFRFIQFTTASRNSKLLFKRGKCQVVLSLNKGVKLNEILDQLSNSLFETS